MDYRIEKSIPIWDTIRMGSKDDLRNDIFKLLRKDSHTILFNHFNVIKYPSTKASLWHSSTSITARANSALVTSSLMSLCRLFPGSFEHATQACVSVWVSVVVFDSGADRGGGGDGNESRSVPLNEGSASTWSSSSSSSNAYMMALKTSFPRARYFFFIEFAWLWMRARLKRTPHLKLKSSTTSIHCPICKPWSERKSDLNFAKQWTKTTRLCWSQGM